MNQMARLEQAVFFAHLQRITNILQRLQANIALIKGPNGNAVINRCDARRNDLRVMGDRGRNRRPHRTGAGHDVLFNVIGMKLDHAGHQIIPRAINNIRTRQGRNRVPFFKGRDQPIRHGHAAGRHNAISQNNARIGKNGCPKSILQIGVPGGASNVVHVPFHILCSGGNLEIPNGEFPVTNRRPRIGIVKDTNQSPSRRF